MPVSRRVARPLLAAIFIVGGFDAVRNPAGKAKKAEAVIAPLKEQLDIVPDDTEMLVRLNGAVQIAGGTLLAAGRFRRLASLVLIGSIIPTTYAGHRFWEEVDDTTRAQQKMHFLKNLGLLGGLILAALDTEGEPSLSWRAKRRARQLEVALALGRAASAPKAHVTGSKGHTTASKASKVGGRAARKANAVARRAAQKANAAGAEVVRHANVAASDVARQTNALAAGAARQAGSAATDTAQQVKPATLQRRSFRPGVGGPVSGSGCGAGR